MSALLPDIVKVETCEHMILLMLNVLKFIISPIIW